jgi:hypothetical protein
MAEGIISRKGSSFSTNGITRSVHVRRGNSVALGEPVELAIAPSITSNSSVISASTGNTQVIYKTITLDDTRTLILYTASSPSGPLSAVVQTLNKSTQSVSVGTAFLISLSNIGSDYVRNFDAILMNDGRVLLAMSGANVTSGPTGRRRVAAILTITGTVVTLTGQSILDTTNTANTGTQLGSLAVINNNQFLYLHAGQTATLSSRPTATVLTVSGNTITSNEQFILDSASTQTGVDVVKIDENRFLATYSNSSNFPVVLILVFTAPDIITMGTAYIPHNQTLARTSNKVMVTSPNRAFIAFPSGSSYLAARYSFSGASMTLITTLTLPYSYSSTGDFVINSQSIKLMMSKNDTLNIFYWTSQSQSSTGYINHSCYDSRFNNVFNSNHIAFSTSSSYFYGFDVNQLTNNYFLITTSQGTSSTFSIVTGTLSNASWVVYPVATFTSVRGITLQAQTENNLVDVIFPQTVNSNPFIPI